MSDKAGVLVFLGIIGAGIGISLLLSKGNSGGSSYSEDFIEPPETHSARWVKTSKTYENTEHWHISWDLENLIPTDIEIKRLATET